MNLPVWSTVAVFAAVAFTGPASTCARAGDVRFNRDIRPILSDHCFACHGPSESQADLRLDQAESAAAVVEGGVDGSELLRRIESDDEYEVMPPPEAHKPLSDEQKRLLRQWVEQGAPFAQHWSLIPPAKSAVPTADADLPIDHFIDAALAEAGLEPSQPAEKTALARRVALDLTGLPPRPEVLEHFLADESADAYEKLVDTLLADVRYGEHMARYWLDLVRYGDTHGLHLDNYREMWPYRDWVIRSFNENLPYDRFVVEQLAGDLLPEAGLPQLIASGYNRLNVTTNEGGSIYEEVFARNVIDRTEAFGTVFLGLTTGCAVCHDHKFDPITARDFYSLSAFFNSLDGSAMDGNVEDHPPVVRVPSSDHARRMAQLEEQLAALVEELDGPMEQIDQLQRQWEENLAGNAAEPQWQVLTPTRVASERGTKLEVLSDASIAASGENPEDEKLTIEAELPQGTAWRLLRLEVLPPADAEPASARVGRATNGNVVISEIKISAKPAGGAPWLPIELAYAQADFEQPDGKYAVAFAIDGKLDKDAGWALGGHLQTGPRSAWFVPQALLSDESGGRLRVEVICQSQWGQHAPARVRLSVADSLPQVSHEQQLKLHDWFVTGPFPVETHTAAEYRKFGSEGDDFKKDDIFKYRGKDYRWETRAEYSADIVGELPVVEDQPSVTLLHRTIVAPAAMQVSLLVDTDDGFALYVNKERIAADNQPRDLSPLTHAYTVDLKKGENSILLKAINHTGRSQFAFAVRSIAAPLPETIRAAAATSPADRTSLQQGQLRDYFRRVVCVHPDLMAIRAEADGVTRQQKELEQQVPTTLVWRETAEPRDAFILKRGQYDAPGEEVERATPAFLPPMPEDAPRDRLGLAQWVVDESNPLTARVAVNRFWQQVFGIGLVETSEDFGAQGRPPSHPELLDWLAVDFMENGWDIKRLMKQLVMSRAYRRSAVATPEQLKADPRNRLLARGPRVRLDGEVLRDQALAVSGLLVEQLGGPSVKPPQPAGLWEAVGYTRSNTANFVADDGEDVYRRSVYTFWKRTSAPPTLSTFDAPSRESCTARRERTNTPLQALVLLNEQQFFEAAKMLGKRALVSGEDDRERLAWAFRRVTCREAQDDELQELLQLLADIKAMYAEDIEQARKLAGEEAEQPVELAAWTLIANTLFNLDEVINK